jgi:hypothetical protein
MYQVHVTDEFMADGISIWISRKFESLDREILRISGDAHTWERLPDATVTEPTFRLDGESAHALLEAMVRHYQGAEDTRTMRQDLLHERTRRDKLEDHIMFALEMGSRPPRPRLGGGEAPPAR